MIGQTRYPTSADMGTVVLDPRTLMGADQQYQTQRWRPWDAIYHPTLAADVDSRGRGYTVPYNKVTDVFIGNLPVRIQVAQLANQTQSALTPRLISLTIPPQG